MQQPGGIILTMMRFQPWKPLEFIFECCLFAWQLGFLLWTYRFDGARRVITFAAFWIMLGLSIWRGPHWFIFFAYLCLWTLYAVIEGEVPLRTIIFGSRVSHVRLCLEKIEGTNRWRYISQSFPDAKFDEWSEDQLLGRHFIYLPPGFGPSEIFIRAMTDYANDHVKNRGKRGYDVLQLGSFVLNSLLFWWIPHLHGREIIKFMNIPGFREVCSTLVAGILRWAWLSECLELLGWRRYLADGEFKQHIDLYYFEHHHHLKEFFEGYVTAMVSPCLFVIEAFKKETWILPKRNDGKTANSDLSRA